MNRKEHDAARAFGLAAGFLLRNRHDRTSVSQADVEALVPAVSLPSEPLISDILADARVDYIEHVCALYGQLARAAGEEHGVTANRTQTAYNFEAWVGRTRCAYCHRFARIVTPVWSFCDEHDPRKPREGEDPRPGFYYVSAQRSDGRRVLVDGPYVTHREALDAVHGVAHDAAEIDFRAFWYAWGTARSESDLGPGCLKKLLDV